jgi:hypothetical protein
LVENAISGTKEVKPLEYKDAGKNLIKTGNFRHIYVSSIMHEKTKRKSEQFVYAIIATKAEKRNFRCKRFYEIEADKVFVSGKDYAELFLKIKD